jgi:hypothetical protein
VLDWSSGFLITRSSGRWCGHYPRCWSG